MKNVLLMLLAVGAVVATDAAELFPDWDGKQPRAEYVQKLYDRVWESIRAGERNDAMALGNRAVAFSRKHLSNSGALSARCVEAAGLAHMANGLHDEADSLFQHAIELAEREGASGLNVLASVLTSRAWVYRKQKRLDDSLNLLNRARELHASLPKPDLEGQAYTLVNQAFVLQMLKRADEAVPLLKLALENRRKTHGNGHPVTAMSQFQLGQGYEKVGRNEDAEACYRDALKIQDRALGRGHLVTLRTANRIALLLQQAGRKDEAARERERALVPASVSLDALANKAGAKMRGEMLKSLGWYLFQNDRVTDSGPAFQQSMVILGRTDGLDSLTAAGARLGYAKFLDRGTNAAAATPHFERVISIRRQKLGPLHRETILAIEAYVSQLSRSGESARAVKVIEDVLKREGSDAGLEGESASNLRSALARIYRLAGRHDEAAEVLRALVADQAKRHGGSSPIVLTTEFNRMNTLRLAGRLQEAAELMRSIHARRVKSLGPDHPLAINDALQLANRLMDAGRIEEAGEVFQGAVRTSEKVHGANDPKTAEALRGVASSYRASSRYSDAKVALQRALLIVESSLGSEQVQTAEVLYELGECLHEMSQTSKAEGVMRRVLAIRIARLGDADVETATARQYLAHILYSRGRYEEGIKLAAAALASHERHFGKGHHRTMTATRILGLHYHASGKLSEAEPLLRSAFEIAKATLGPTHRDTGYTTRCLASLYFDQGRFTEAEPFLRQAVETAEKNAGPGQNNASRRARHHLARLQYRLGRDNEAIENELKSVTHIRSRFREMFSFMNENERLTFRQSMRPWDLLATLGDGEAIAQTVIQFKGVVLDSMMEEYSAAARSTNATLRQNFDLLARARRQLAASVLNAAVASRSGPEASGKLSSKVADLESRLARAFAVEGGARVALTANLRSIEQALPTGTVLVEYIRYFHHDREGKGEFRFGAVIIRSGQPPAWVSLAAATKVETDLAELQRQMRALGDDSPLRPILRRLHNSVWAPVADKLSDRTERVFLCPDASLNFVPFACLLDRSDKFAGQRWLLSYVSSGRELLRPAERKESGVAVIFAGPEYAVNAEGSSPGKDLAMVVDASRIRAVQGFNFGTLPGATREGRQLAELAKRRGQKVSLFVGRQATETRLRGIRSPQILHLATHGYYLSDGLPSEQSVESPRRGVGGLVDSVEPVPEQLLRSSNPMQRSGLFLTGAKRTIADLAAGVAPPDPANDGVVTAADIATFDLRSTRLVVLSACDTGLGEIQSGEGVMGLRRGFHRAGARNILMTLWPVLDRETAEFMLEFHQAAHAEQPATVLAKVQRNWLQKLRRERDLAAAVKLVGGFVLSSQGRGL